MSGNRIAIVIMLIMAIPDNTIGYLCYSCIISVGH